jgi:glutathione S-transferase
MAKVKVGYWKIRGLAQPIRMLLGYLGIEFEDELYECGDAPEYDRSCWFNVRESLGMEFPNLPYLIDGGIKISQSNAVMRYLGRKAGLDGKTESEKINVDVMENQSMDFRNGFIVLCYRSSQESFEERKKAFIENLKTILTRFDSVLGKRKFFGSDELTFVDFMMYELLDQHRIFDADLLKPYGNITSFLSRFEEIPQIKAFMNSEKCFKGPINNKMAHFK